MHKGALCAVSMYSVIVTNLGNRFSDCATSLISISRDRNGREKKHFEYRDSPGSRNNANARARARACDGQTETDASPVFAEFPKKMCRRSKDLGAALQCLKTNGRIGIDRLL